MGRCALIADGDAISVVTPYDAGFVAQFKMMVPASDRRWDGEKKRWIVTPRHGKTLQDLCMTYFSEIPLVPEFSSTKPVTKSQIMDVRYIGVIKERGGDDRSAFGFYNGGWNVVFPESVLRSWFDAPQYPDEAPSLYSVLGCKRDASEDEVKSAYRRMVMQWHPDKCREPNAQEQFMAIQHAYEVLMKNREKYDAGLALEASMRNTSNYVADAYKFSDGYRAPLRCGLIMCDGFEQLGIFNVTKIHAWEDLRDAQGRVLVVSWAKGADKFSEVWA